MARLVAEFVAARHDDRGVLVLRGDRRRAGTVRRAHHQSMTAQGSRVRSAPRSTCRPANRPWMRRMRRIVAGHDVFVWASGSRQPASLTAFGARCTPLRACCMTIVLMDAVTNSAADRRAGWPPLLFDLTARCPFDQSSNVYHRTFERSGVPRPQACQPSASSGRRRLNLHKRARIAPGSTSRDFTDSRSSARRSVHARGRGAPDARVAEPAPAAFAAWRIHRRQGVFDRPPTMRVDGPTIAQGAFLDRPWIWPQAGCGWRVCWSCCRRAWNKGRLEWIRGAWNTLRPDLQRWDDVTDETRSAPWAARHDDRGQRPRVRRWFHVDRPTGRPSPVDRRGRIGDPEGVSSYFCDRRPRGQARRHRHRGVRGGVASRWSAIAQGSRRRLVVCALSWPGYLRRSSPGQGGCRRRIPGLRGSAIGRIYSPLPTII